MCIRDSLKYFLDQFDYRGYANGTTRLKLTRSAMDTIPVRLCLLYTSDAADERSSVDLGGRRIIQKKKSDKHWVSECNELDKPARLETPL